MTPLDVAVHVFFRTRGNTRQCLEAAIKAYQEEEKYIPLNMEGVVMEAADTDTGPDTALVITGFTNLSDIEKFISEKLRAPGK